MKKKVLIIIAHPDDETIWMGGTLLRNKNNWESTLICLCRESDKDREPKFRKACEIFGIKSHIYDLDDQEFYPIKEKEILEKILENAKEHYDIIYTHGKNGEYGHIRHKEIHKAVKNAVKNGILKSEKIIFFSYLKRKNNFQGYATYNSKANIFIKLNPDELELKKKIIMDIYGYQKDGFEEKSSAEIESFDEIKK